jgi:UrcA family protein
LNKFVALAALATVSAAIAAPASAATLVRISLANKSDAQISGEIQTAATTVCAAEKSSGRECIDSTVRDATRQLNAIKARSTSKAAVRREAISVVRVSLKGKTTEQIHAEIKIAAETVCKSTKTGFINRADYEACVGGAVRSAKAQLQAFNSAQAKQVASL